MFDDAMTVSELLNTYSAVFVPVVIANLFLIFGFLIRKIKGN